MYIEEYFGQQSEFYRLAYVVKANDHLIQLVEQMAEEWEEGDEEMFKEPEVIVTEAEQLEGYRFTVEEKVKEAFLRERIKNFPFSDMSLGEDVFVSQEKINDFFEKYFDIEETSSFNFLKTETWSENVKKISMETKKDCPCPHCGRK